MDGPRLIHDYDHRMYGGTPPALRLDDLGDEANREAATELFVLAALHTTPFGNLSSWGNFVARCRSKDKGWLETFAAAPPDPAAWMDVLNEYVREEGGPHYKLEMQRFPEILPGRPAPSMSTRTRCGRRRSSTRRPRQTCSTPGVPPPSAGAGSATPRRSAGLLAWAGTSCSASLFAAACMVNPALLSAPATSRSSGSVCWSAGLGR